MKSELDQILNEVRNFLKSRAILTAAELDLFTRLAEKPASIDELAREKQLDPRATTRLLDMLVTLELIGKGDGLYWTASKAAQFSSHHPESVLPMILHLNQLWDSWSHLTETVRNGSNPDRKKITERGEESLKSFIGAMDVIGRGIAVEIAEFYDAGRFTKLLDIGGASGTYTIAFLRKNPGMSAVLFDLPDVIAMAEDNLTKAGVRDRVELVAGDFYRDELPPGCDLAFLSAIIHQNSPTENIQLYRKIYRALVPRGCILIRDHIMDQSRTKPPAGALFALNMLVNTRGGDTYTFQEVKEQLEEAGFTSVTQVRSGEKMDCLVQASKQL